jgi:xanthine dehydrogenase accessory factor
MRREDEVIMRDILDDVQRWKAEGKQIAVATVAHTYGSALRPLGAKFACTSTGEVTGSVSGGCVEGAVYEAAQGTLQTGQPVLLEFGIADETAWSVGLACGGTVHVWVEVLDEAVLDAVTEHLTSARPFAVATVIAGPGTGRRIVVGPDGPGDGTMVTPELDGQVTRYARDRLILHDPGRAAFGTGPERVEVLVEVFGPQPRLIVVGAVHIAIPLVTFGKALGFHTVVVDARATFATRERFPHVDDLIVEWPSRALERLQPDAETYVVIVTHDDKVDVPALQVALAAPTRYVGILGSRGHQAQRAAALVDRGVPAEQLTRIHGPAGLRIGAVGPDEIAIGIMAEVVAARHGVDTGQAARSMVASVDGRPGPEVSSTRPEHRP